jgi:hypothetical protein
LYRLMVFMYRLMVFMCRLMVFMYRLMVFMYRLMVFMYRLMVFMYRLMVFMYRLMVFMYRLMVFNTAFNNISVISWQLYRKRRNNSSALMFMYIFWADIPFFNYNVETLWSLPFRRTWVHLQFLVGFVLLDL